MANKLLTTAFRTYRLPKSVREAMTWKRKALGQTVREYLVHAIDTELPGLVVVLEREVPSFGGEEAKPARLPLSEALLETLQAAGDKTGIPASRLLMVCLARAGSRKRRGRQRGQ